MAICSNRHLINPVFPQYTSDDDSLCLHLIFFLNGHLISTNQNFSGTWINYPEDFSNCYLNYILFLFCWFIISLQLQWFSHWSRDFTGCHLHSRYKLIFLSGPLLLPKWIFLVNFMKDGKPLFTAWHWVSSWNMSSLVNHSRLLFSLLMCTVLMFVTEIIFNSHQILMYCNFC